MRRLLLVRHATTACVRRSAFPLNEPLDARGRAEAGGLFGVRELRTIRDAYASTALRARETAAAAGLDAAVDPALDECDFGAWRGRTLADVYAQDAGAVLAWWRDPAAAPHGGESLASLMQRVAAWLDDQAQREGTAAAVTHAGPVKAAVVYALAAPPQAFWRIDVAPLGITELHAHDGRWTVARLNWRPHDARATGVAPPAAAAASWSPA